MKFVALISSVCLIAGSLLPWWPGAGADKSISIFIITLLTGCLNLGRSIYALFKNRRIFSGFIASGILCITLIAVELYNILSGYSPPNDVAAWLSSYGQPGLYLAITGSAGLLISGLSIGFPDIRAFIVEVYQSRHQGRAARFIANRVAFNPQKSFSRFIIRLSTVATIISVAVMIITLSLANGFQDAVSQKVFSFWGHIRIQEKQPEKSVLTEETPIIQNGELVKLIKNNPEVRSIHPFATKYAILKTKEEIEGVLVKGLDSTYDFDNFRQFIREGRPIRFNDSTYSREIMISANTASQLQVKLNDRILIYFIRPDGTLRPDRLTITGIYKTGIEDYDKTFAIGDIKLIQRLNEWNTDEIGGYEVFINDYDKMDLVAQDIFAISEFPEIWDTKTVKEISPNIFDWLNMQDVTRNVLIGFMIAVAIINLITCLIILVLERVQMIGVIKSLGASNWTIQRIFLRHSLVITITGIIIGTAVALGLLYLQQQTGFIKLKEEAYYLSEAAVKIVWWQVLAIGIGTLLITLLVLMIPSILARKVQPVKAIHFR